MEIVKVVKLQQYYDSKRIGFGGEQTWYKFTQMSSNVAEASYDAKRRMMTIIFQNRYMYVLRDVEPQFWQDFLRVKSKGKFWWRRVRRPGKGPVIRIR